MTRFLSPVTSKRASAQVAAIYQDVRQTFPGPVPEPYRLFAHFPDFLSAVWRDTKETYLSGTLRRVHKDVVAAAVSRTNECSFCVVAHGELVAATSRDAAAALRAGLPNLADDQDARGFIEWGLATRNPDAKIIRCPPFQNEVRPEVIWTAVQFHCMNRLINLLLDPHPVPGPALLRPVLMFLGRPIMRRLARLTLPMPTGVGGIELPPDLGWIKGNRTVAASCARMVDVTENGSIEFVDIEVRKVVADAIAVWRGEDIRPGSKWFHSAVQGLNTDHRPVAMLLLQVAVASARVDRKNAEAAASILGTEHGFMAATAWAAFLAARRVGSWL